MCGRTRIDSIGRITISSGMAATALPYSAPRWADSLSTFADQGDWTPRRLAESRERISKTCSDNRTVVEEIRVDTEVLLSRIISGDLSDSATDLDEAIDVFDNFEDKLIEDRGYSVKKLDKLIKGLSVSATGARTLLNEYRKEMIRCYFEMTAIHRDARWKLMAYRAQRWPSGGAGPIHGSGEPPDGVQAA